MQTTNILYKIIPAKNSNIGLIILNRPEALNALSGEMILSLQKQLLAWRDDDKINLVIITGNGGRSFCAGGDLKMVYNFGREHYKDGMHFYTAEYALNLLIKDFPKPYVAILNGIAMGGGLGLSLHGARVIATEKLKLAMPEVGIGFFPDVGASNFFAKCPDSIGTYLGLTGNSIEVADALYARLINAYIPSIELDNFLADLSTFDLNIQPLNIIDSIIKHYAQPTENPPLAEYADIISKCFTQPTVEAIINALQNDGSPWADKVAATLLQRSPTSLKVTLRMLRIGASMPLQACLSQELILTNNLMQEHDIYEGIRAVLIDKTNDPKWQPATLASVTDADIDKLFK